MWILPDHNKFSAFAQDMAVSSLDLSEQACVLSQSLMWRSKPSPSATWCRRLKKESWLQHLSTQILKPSRTERFVERWTASLGAIPASRSRQQESDLEKKTQDTSGPTLQTAFAFADPDGASLKTLKDTLPAGCVTSCQTWQEWVTEQRGDYSQRVKLAHHTKGSGSTSWPTVAAHEPRLGNQIRRPGKKGTQKSLTTIVMEQNGPAAQDNPSTTGNRQGYAEQWATPRANEVHPYITEKNRNHLANRNKSNLEEDVAGYIGSVTGKLNPRWVETLMGLPIGWVSPEPATHTTCTNRTDELRMLGNGVVPQTAAKAFTILAERLQ